MTQQGHEHVVSDERILGDSACGEKLFSEADEAYKRGDELKRLCYNANRSAQRRAKIYEMDPFKIFFIGKQ